MSNIIAIGGGRLSGPHTITPIHQEIVASTTKTNPLVVFIPTASSDDTEYVTRMENEFKNLGCSFDPLYLIKEKPNIETIERRLIQADIIYVGGGNTLKMMTLWRRLGIDKLLAHAHASNKVLCGPSAGSICWFAFGNSDSRKYKNPDADLIKVRGLRLINALHCPHYDSEKDRRESLKHMMKKVHGLVAIALDDCCALQVKGDRYRILSTKPTANAYKIYWKRGVFYHEPIAKTTNFASLAELLKKE